MERVKKIKSIAEIPIHERGCILPPNFMAQAIKWREQNPKSNLRPHFAYKVK